MPPQGVPAPEAHISDPATSAQARVFVCLSHLSVWVLGPCEPGGGCPGRAVLPRAVPTLPRGLSAAVWGEHRELGALSTPPQGSGAEEARTRLSRLSHLTVYKSTSPFSIGDIINQVYKHRG